MATRTLTEAEKQQIYEDIRTFLSDELDVPLDDIKPDSKILEDLKGDSMIYLELVEEFKKKFDVSVEIRVIGLYFQRHPVYTVAEVAKAVCDIVERGDELVKIAEAEIAADGTSGSAPN
jgi:acyl carrier protein|uniref:Acyl carrier protein n=1 Tax=Schlesneria paludicola TaxID=360056 RepID=A0A7C4LMR3_9PLAN